MFYNPGAHETVNKILSVRGVKNCLWHTIKELKKGSHSITLQFVEHKCSAELQCLINVFKMPHVSTTDFVLAKVVEL